MSSLDKHEKYMQLALELAKKGNGYVSPNPMVGCVIVHEETIIGQGYHQKYGEPHAEPNAVASVVDKSLIKDADVYVTLEPCAHFGKTPPCANLLAELKPKRVFVANVDSNPLVGGKGLKILENAGVEVITGVLEQEASVLNKRFFTFMNKKRPYVLLKWAQTEDGFIAGEYFQQVQITNQTSSKIVHQMRAEEAAILVGFHTALHDNPSLTTRLVDGKNPLRLFIDKRLEIPGTHQLLDKTTPTICYNLQKSSSEENIEFVKLTADDFVPQILEDLYHRKINSLMVEGGTQLLNSFLENNLWDEAQVFQAQKKLGKGIGAPMIKEEPVSKLMVETDQLSVYKNVL